jgi:hypothetical protein
MTVPASRLEFRRQDREIKAEIQAASGAVQFAVLGPDLYGPLLGEDTS